MTPHLTSSPWATRAPLAVAITVSAALLMTAALPGGPVVAGGEPGSACDAEPIVMTTADGIDFVRTPDACFTDLPDWPYEPRYVEIDGLRQAYVEEAPPTARSSSCSTASPPGRTSIAT